MPLLTTCQKNFEKQFGDVDENIPDTSGLVPKTLLNTKIREAENKILDTNDLETILNTNISEVKNKTPDNSKYITNQEFNKLTTEIFDTRVKQADLVNKADFDMNYFK